MKSPFEAKTITTFYNYRNIFNFIGPSDLFYTRPGITQYTDRITEEYKFGFHTGQIIAFTDIYYPGLHIVLISISTQLSRLQATAVYRNCRGSKGSQRHEKRGMECIKIPIPQ